MNSIAASDTIVQEVEIKGTAERIFEALTNPEQRIKWWAAEGRFEISQMESDLRPGGKWSMRGTGMGKAVTISGEYLRIDRPRLLEFTWLPTWQGDDTVSTVRIELQTTAGVTKVRLTHSGLVTEGARNSHRGWALILSLLQGFVEK